MDEMAEEALERARAKWDYRLIDALKGNQTLMGAIVIAICGKAPNHPPRVLTGGVISPDGLLLINFESRADPGEAHQVIVGPIEQVRDEFRNVCNMLALPDDEQEAFFGEFRKWIVKDWRGITLMKQHNVLQ